MYDYRKWSAKKQAAALNERVGHGFPLHSPPHVLAPDVYRLITGACFEHKPILESARRLKWFEQKLLDHLRNQSLEVAAWVVLPNHYHVLVKIPDIKKFTKAQGQLHGSTSLEMNREDNQLNRQVWYRCSDRFMRSKRHFYTTLNYIHNNPVKHGYVDKWGDWAFSSFHWYLENKGRNWLVELWQEHPLLNYGDNWDVL
ncbi:transposase [Mariniblastus sp.]|nr:transposase [Mariniblastus sp.]